MNWQEILILIAVLLVLSALIKLVLFRWKRLHYRHHSQNLRFLQIKMPRTDSDSDKSNDVIQGMKQNIEVMTQVYKNFYAISTKNILDRIFGQPCISCELIVEKELIKFMLAVPKDYKETFEKIISSFYPGAVIDQIAQPKLLHAGKYMWGGYFVMTKDTAFPIKTYENFEVDPMDSVLSGFARVGTDETLVLQILVSPLSERRQKKVRKKVDKVKKGNQWFLSFFKWFFVNDDKESTGGEENHDYSSQQIWDIEKKAEDEWFAVVLKTLAVSPDATRPEKIINDLKRSLNQYNYIWLNSLVYLPANNIKKFTKEFVMRLFKRPHFTFEHMLFRIRSQILNIKELGSIFHFPHDRFNKNPRIVRQKFKIVPAPDNISTEGIILGDNLYGWVKKEIRLGFEDRFRHLYIIGQTWTGKSTILRTMLNQDMAAGHGFTLIDPHGDLAESCLEYFPKERIDDLIYRDAGNMELPVGFNFLSAKTEREMDLVTNDAVDMFVKLFGSEVFGPRIQDYFRNAVLTLMEQPDGGTLVEIMRLFTDEAYQKMKVKNVKNPVVRARWEKTYNSMGDREKKEIIPYFQAKFWPFSTTPILRNIIGQAESSFDIGEVMDSGKCLIMNLSKGQMGDINADLLGMMIVSQVRLSAFRRANQDEKDRVPHFLYIDEFQNFVTPAIESILSEARKYKLGLVIAHQYLDQLVREGTSSKGGVNLKDPIFGNVGNMMAYRVGAKDAEQMEQEFAPKFSQADLINLDKFKWVIKLSVDMQPTPAFSINVRLPWEQPPLNTPEKAEIIKQISALKYGRKKDLVEKELFYRVGA